MVSDHFDYVVIDGEAGIEQINRRVMEKVNHLVYVSDASKKGLDVVNTIDSVAKELVMAEQTGLIINRVSNPKIVEHLDLGNLRLLAAIGNDDTIQEYDIQGKSILDIPKDTNIYLGAYSALKEMGIIV